MGIDPAESPLGVVQTALQVSSWFGAAADSALQVRNSSDNIMQTGKYRIALPNEFI